MTQPAKAKEPSMEEILASIRRIIADDDATKTPAKAADPPPPPPPPRPPAPPPRPVAVVPVAPVPPPPPAVEVDAMLSDLDTEPPLAPDPTPDVLDLTEAMAAPMPPVEGFRTIDGQSDLVFEDTDAAPEPMRPMGSATLMSAPTGAAVESAFNALAQTVLVHNARTLEDLVREMLRPLLKTWLDDNLPSLVERLVRSEIDRVSRGRS
jgi:cell pole-organizing protein PopZ